jgi:hypothetical protein
LSILVVGAKGDLIAMINLSYAIVGLTALVISHLYLATIFARVMEALRQVADILEGEEV